MPQKMFPLKISWCRAIYEKFRFSLISLSVTLKKSIELVYPQFWCHRPSQQLVWTVIPQTFHGGPKSRPNVKGLAYSTLQSQPTWKVVHDFRRFYVFFFYKISFSGPTVNFGLFMSYIFWKLLFQRLILAIHKPFLSILRFVRFLFTQWDAYTYM